MGAVDPAYFFNDVIKDLAASSIALTSEDVNYPTEYSQEEQIAMPTRTTAKVDILYQLNAGALIQPQIFFIGNHNFASGNVNVYSYSDAAFSVDKTLVATIVFREKDMFVRIAAAPTARQYWEFDFTKNGTVTSSDSYLSFGRPMLGTDYTTLDTEDVSQGREFAFGNVVNVTPFGCRNVHKLWEERETFGLTWRRKQVVNLPDDLKTLFSAVGGDAHPFVFIPSIAGLDCYYVHIATSSMEWLQINAPDIIVENLMLVLVEEIRGRA